MSASLLAVSPERQLRHIQEQERQAEENRRRVELFEKFTQHRYLPAFRAVRMLQCNYNYLATQYNTALERHEKEGQLQVASIFALQEKLLCEQRARAKEVAAQMHAAQHYLDALEREHPYWVITDGSVAHYIHVQ